jgi:hypothetical protein
MTARTSITTTSITVIDPARPGQVLVTHVGLPLANVGGPVPFPAPHWPTIPDRKE